MTRYGKAIATPSGEGSSSRASDPITVTATQQSGESGGSENTFAGTAVEQIEALVESFRSGQVKKSQTIVKIAHILEAQPGGDEQLKSESLDRYVSTLDRIETIAAQSDERGARLTNPILGKRKENDKGPSNRHEEFDGNIPDVVPTVDFNDFVDRLSREGESGMGGDDSGGGSDPDSDSEPESDDEPKKRG